MLHILTMMGVIVDQVTQMAHFIPTHTNIKMPEFARLFVKYLYQLYDHHVKQGPKVQQSLLASGIQAIGYYAQYEHN